MASKGAPSLQTRTLDVSFVDLFRVVLIVNDNGQVVRG